HRPVHPPSTPSTRTLRDMHRRWVLKMMNGLHRTALVLSLGRLGWRAEGMPVLELTTTGRKTGRARSCLLTSPLQFGETYVVVASRGGGDEHPDWYLNLTAHPEVQVSIGGSPKERRQARVASAEERAEMWPKAAAVYRNYSKYQSKTHRESPMVFLEPVS
ncbi:MAG: nitroreductase/quinone reductase family protein, partial [Ilumatobacteraceae bacterium]